MFRQLNNRREMERLRQDFDRLFENTIPWVYRQRSRTYPAINIWTKEDEGVIVMAELPGVSPEAIDISVTKDTLTVSGNCRPRETPETENYHRQELTYGEFSRSIQLPYTVDSSKVEASLDKGILKISLPRAEAEKPKQISVKAGS